jgi:hypothetical protein
MRGPVQSTCWEIGEKCKECGDRLATDGRIKWCPTCEQIEILDPLDRGATWIEVKDK